MAISENSSTSVPPQTITLSDQEMRLLVEVPRLLVTVQVLLPLARVHLRELLVRPRTTRQEVEAEGWALGVALADDVLGRMRPAGHALVRHLLDLEARSTSGGGL